jgi:Ni/Fe-hydrogenase 1 B-type cytochrome subunit
MTIIEPTRKDILHAKQTKKYSASLRLWHWANTIIICGSLITVLINSTITSDQNTSFLIKDELQKSGAIISDNQALSVSHALGDKVWDIHIYFGYGLAALLFFRLILEFFQLTDQKFIRKIKSAYHQFQSTKKNREIVKHELSVKIIYAFFYMLLLIMVTTGLTLAFKHELAIPRAIGHTIQDVHGFCMYLILTFIAVHLAGVFLAERKQSKGIVSDIINGGHE